MWLAPLQGFLVSLEFCGSALRQCQPSPGTRLLRRACLYAVCARSVGGLRCDRRLWGSPFLILWVCRLASSALCDGRAMRGMFQKCAAGVPGQSGSAAAVCEVACANCHCECCRVFSENGLSADGTCVLVRQAPLVARFFSNHSVQQGRSVHRCDVVLVHLPAVLHCSTHGSWGRLAWPLSVLCFRHSIQTCLR